MGITFLNNSINITDIVLPESDKINPFIKKNNYNEIIKAIEFLDSEEQFLYIHGFLGTGKRQFVNYITEFLDKDIVQLVYYCKKSTVCDDIMIAFIDYIEKLFPSKFVNINSKITTLAVKFQKIISNINRPVIIILHSFDDVLEENRQLVINCLETIIRNKKIKLIISTRAMEQDVAGNIKVNRKIFLKAFTSEIFREYLKENNIEATETTMDDFFKYTRGYYYYTALALKIISAMKYSLNEFLNKYTASGLSFDEYLGLTYINLIPNTIRNFFWFLRTVRHGLTLNALAVFDLYDEFSVEYLKNNLMIFQVDDTIYVQDYFLQNIDISIPEKTEIKLHKYIISIYEKQLKEPLQAREILISRQALRAEIDYHTKCIKSIEEHHTKKDPEPVLKREIISGTQNLSEKQNQTLAEKAQKLVESGNTTDAIEIYQEMLNNGKLDLQTIVSIRLSLARIYKKIEDYSKSLHYYELVETYYKQHKEVINLNYLYYEITEVYYLTYKSERAIDTIKKVIYSIDTPQSLLVSACILLGNIFSDKNNSEEAYMYYKKAVESLDSNTSEETLAELYFKLALANDDREEYPTAFDYYNKCISLVNDSPYKALAYSNMGSCYLENKNYTDAETCFKHAYEIEKKCNNYNGIYYTSLHLAKIYSKLNEKQALNFFIEAKQSAEFLNEQFYILEASIELGDYYYNDKTMQKKALEEYFAAKHIAQNLDSTIDIAKIDERIRDMKLRVEQNVFDEIERKYE